MEKKETSYQKLKRTVAQKDEQISHFKKRVNNLKKLSVDLVIGEREEVRKKDVEYAVLKEAFELIGGHEAVDKKLAEAKQLKAKHEKQYGLMKSEKMYMQHQHDKELKVKTELLKDEYTYAQKGHEFDRTLTIEERKSKINDAVDKDKLYTKMFDSIERKEKWEKRVEPIKKAAETVKNVSKAAVKTANDLVVNPVKKQVNDAVVVPANLSMKMMKENLNKEMDMAKESLNRDKEKVIGFGKTVKSFANKANKSLKTMVMKHTVLNKTQEKEAKNEQELGDIKWGTVVARASMNISESLSDKLSSKFSKLKTKVTQNFKESVAKTKETFTQHLHAEKEKQNVKTKSKEKGGPEL